MKIEYRILWIDDSEEWVESKLEGVQEYLFEHGFVLEHDVFPAYDKDIDFSKYDIIAVDCNLSDSERGIDILKVIRDKDIYTEILFYSLDGESVLRAEVSKNKIDGVYCAYRDDAIDTLKGVILTTIKKTQEINNLRGLVMAETSELDNIMKLILLSRNWSEDHYTHSHGKVSEHLTVKITELESFIPYHPDKVSSLVHGHLSAWTSHDSLKKILTKEEWATVKGYQEVMKKRNILAHGIEEETDGPEKFVVKQIKPDGSEVLHEYTSDDFIVLRKDIKLFKESMRSLLP